MQPRPDENSLAKPNAQFVLRAGPLPSPDELAGYEKVCPGAAEIILKNFVRQSEHRCELEKKQADSEIKINREAIRLTEKEIDNQDRMNKRTQFIGAVILFILVVLSAGFASFGNNVVALCFFGPAALKCLVDLLRPSRSASRPE